MRKYVVWLKPRLEDDSDFVEVDQYYLCEAESPSHAVEQAEDAFPDHWFFSLAVFL